MWWCLAEEFVDVGKERDIAQLEIAAAREAKDRKAEAKAVRRLARAKLAEVEDLRWEAARDCDRMILATFEEAEGLITDHLQDSRKANDRWAEAAMLLTLGEVEKERLEHLNSKTSEFEPVLRMAEDASRVFQEMGDNNMEAYAWMLAAEVHRRHEEASASWKVGANKTFDDLDQALLLLDDTEDIMGIARAKHALAIAYIRRNEAGEGLRLLEDARDGFLKLQHKRLEAFELLTIGEVHLSRKSCHEALPNAEEALQLYSEIMPDCRRVLECKNLVVKAHFKRGDDETAVRLATEWLESAEEKGLPRQLCSAHMNLASILISLSREKEAMESLNQAQSLARKVGDVRWEFDFLCQTVDLLVALRGHTDEAQFAADGAIAIARELRDRKREGTALGKASIVMLYRLLESDDLGVNETQTFEQLIEDQRAIFSETEDYCAAASARLGIVGLRGTETNYEAGRKVAEEVRKEFQALNDKGGEARALHFLVELYGDLEQYEMSVRMARDMWNCGKEIGDDAIQLRSLRVLSKIHLTFEHYKEARRAAEKGAALAVRVMDAASRVDFLILIANACTYISGQDRHPTTARATLAQAKKHASEALNLSRRMRDKTAEGNSLVQLARIGMQKAQSEDPTNFRSGMDEAMRYAHDAVQIFRQQKNTEKEADATTTVALMLHLNGEQAKAEDAAEHALLLARRCGEVDVSYVAMETYRQVMGSNGRPISEEKLQQVLERLGPTAMDDSSAPSMGRGLDVRMVREVVAELASRATELQSPQEMDSRLVEMGMDSLTAVSFRNGLQQKFGLKLASSILFDFPTMRELTDHIVKELHEANVDN